MDFLDSAFKFEAIFDGLQSTYLWLSGVELIFFLFNIVFFVLNPANQLWYAVLFLLFHVVRASIGFYITQLIPSSHQITSKIGYKGDV